MLFKICKKKNKNGRFVFASQMTRTCLNVRLGSLASPPVMSYKPILFLAHRPAVKRCLALAAPFELKRALLPPSAFCVVAHLKQNIPFASLHDLLQLLSANQLSTTPNHQLEPFCCLAVQGSWWRRVTEHSATDSPARRSCRPLQPARMRGCEP